MINVGISVIVTGPMNECLRGQKDSFFFLCHHFNHIGGGLLHTNTASSSYAHPLNDRLEVPRGRNYVLFTIVPLAPNTMSRT